MAANAARAAAFRAEVLPLIAEIRADGITSLSGIARELSARGWLAPMAACGRRRALAMLLAVGRPAPVPAHALDRASRRY